MRYYTENNRPQLLWASICTAAYVVILLLLFFYVRFDVSGSERTADEILVEFLEPEQDPEPEEPRREQVAEPQQHDRVAPVDNERQVTGTDTKTQTVNEKATFKMPKGGVDEPENAGNPKAPQGDKDEASGKGGGLNPVGTPELDAGLQGRGLVGTLPRPVYGGNSTGTVVVRVVVNEKGEVTSVKHEQIGSTTSDNALIEAALAAARKARFTESRAFAEGGTITYRFTLK